MDMDVGLGAGAQHNEAIEGCKIFRPAITELPQAAPRWWPGYRRNSELLTIWGSYRWGIKVEGTIWIL
jgi:hypothetical protein